MVQFVRDINAQVKVAAAICHAGWMPSRRISCGAGRSRDLYSIHVDLRNAGAEVVDREVVRDGNLDHILHARRPGRLLPHDHKGCKRRRGRLMFGTRLGTGDEGYTDLMGPERVAKYDLRPETCVGTLDEATSALGLARALSYRHACVKSYTRRSTTST